MLRYLLLTVAVCSHCFSREATTRTSRGRKPTGNARNLLPQPRRGDTYGHLFPAADSISIGVFPQLAPQHDRACEQALCSSGGRGERLIILALVIEHTGLRHKSFDIVRPLSG